MSGASARSSPSPGGVTSSPGRHRIRTAVRTDRGLLLLLTPLIWGVTFPAGKLALETLPLLQFTAWSRVLGALTILALLPMVLRRTPRRVRLRRLIGPGVVLGGIMFVAYLLQTAGLERTTATNAGFITGLYVVFVPILGLVLFRRRTSAVAWVAVAISIVGLGLLSVPGLHDLRPHVGDLLVLASALGWAGHVVAVGFFAERYPAVPLSLAQMVAAAVFHLAVAAPTGLHLEAAADVWVLLVITGVLGSGVAFTIQVVAQGIISPTRAAVILAGESVVSAAAAAIWIGERLAPHQWVGALLAISAMVVSEVGARRSAVTRIDPATAV
jgi:drug/metabolite transporter (DMT)-like permease